MKVLITGISGRIGANVAKVLAEEGHTIRGLVWARDRRSGKLAGLPAEFVEGDLTDPAAVEEAVDGVDAICHLGAAFQGGGPFTNEESFEINVRGTFNILEAARKRGSGLKHLFFASSDALYDKYTAEGVEELIREDEFPLRPQGWYAFSKHVGEDMCMGYFRTYKVPLTIFRFAMTMAGEEVLNFRQFYLPFYLDAYKSPKNDEEARTLAELQRIAETHGPNTMIVARLPDGRPYKKHISDVRDIVVAFTAAFGNPDIAGRTFQLGAPSAFTWEEAVPYIAGKLGLPYADVRLSGGRPTFYEFDLSQARSMFGYAPTYDIRRMVDSALAQRAGEAEDVIPV